MKSHKHLHPIQRWKSLGIDYKVLSCALVLVVIVGGLFGFAKIQDQRNEQFLRQIVADFDTLEAELEQATGVEVEDKSGCFTTSEKFGEGKTGCFVQIEGKKESASIKTDVLESNLFSNVLDNISEFRDEGYEATYGNRVCTFFFNQKDTKSFGIECPVPVRAGNRDLVRSLF